MKYNFEKKNTILEAWNTGIRLKIKDLNHSCAVSSKINFCNIFDLGRISRNDTVCFPPRSELKLNFSAVYYIIDNFS